MTDLMIIGIVAGIAWAVWIVFNPVCPECQERFYGPANTVGDVMRCPHCDYEETL